MKRQLILSAMLVAAAGAMACTNFIVGKKASVDGSVICSYSADSYGMFQGLKHQPAAKHPKGAMRQVYDWDTNKYLGEIAEAEETYNVIGIKCFSLSMVGRSSFDTSVISPLYSTLYSNLKYVVSFLSSKIGKSVIFFFLTENTSPGAYP